MIDLARGERQARIPPYMKRCSIVIVNTNEGAVLFDCLEHIRRAGLPFETILVDNASTDGSRERVERDYPWVMVIAAPTNLGYARANNEGARTASGDVFFFLNPDAFVEPGWERLIERFDDETVGAAGPRIYRGRDGETLDSAGGVIEYPLGDAPGRGYLQRFGPPYDRAADVAYLSGAALAIRADEFRRLGGFDEDFFCYYEETDLCWRLRMAGKRCVYEPGAIVRHLGSFTFGSSPTKVRYQTRNRIATNLQNLPMLSLPIFVAAEALVGACVIAGSVFFPKYRKFGGAYALGWGDVVKALPRIARTRRLRRGLRAVGDRIVLDAHEHVGVVEVMRRYVRLALQGGDALFADGATTAAAPE
ncbi:MAG TPA: glycosyltransferase family 2 protein [Candidatus Eremiobacteraceae bacterium]|nr:glycosyltransferase family 2 protein [Candidatus Eremiobacteraceae bacterium]